MINRWLLKLAIWLDRKSKHRDPDFCALIDRFYVETGQWK